MTFPRYVPRMHLATGGMAEIWLGLIEGPAGYQKPCVIKRAAQGSSVERDHARNALIEEARVSALLSHPNIVHTYSLVEIDGELCLAMEYVPGLSLRAVTTALAETETPLPTAVALRLLADAARGLEHAHNAADATGASAPIVHGDLSPENLVVTEAGVTKLLDFGCARLAGDEGSIFGKAAYTAPERGPGSPARSSSDIFALGVVAHELLSGRELFRRTTKEETQTAVAQAPIPALPAGIAPSVQDAVQRALTRDLALRRITAGQLADAFEAGAADLGAGHSDVAIFMRAEFAPVLHARRLKLRDLLAEPKPIPQPTRLNTTTTSVALDGLFDAVTVRARRPVLP